MMRVLASLAALLLIAAPLAAHADGIERPHHVVRHHPHRLPPPPPAPVIEHQVEVGPETVTLSQAFFIGSGGVGTDIGTGYVGGGTTVITGGGGRAVAVAFASTSAHAGLGVHGGGHFGVHGGGCGCH